MSERGPFSGARSDTYFGGPLAAFWALFGSFGGPLGALGVSGGGLAVFRLFVFVGVVPCSGSGPWISVRLFYYCLLLVACQLGLPI